MITTVLHLVVVVVVGGGVFLDFFIPYTIYLYFKIKVVFIRCAAAIDLSTSNMHAYEVAIQREFFNVSISFKDFD